MPHMWWKILKSSYVYLQDSPNLAAGVLLLLPCYIALRIYLASSRTADLEPSFVAIVGVVVASHVAASLLGVSKI